MSGSDNLQPEQLSMFMTAREISERYTPLSGDRRTKYGKTSGMQNLTPTFESNENFWGRKYKEATRPNKKRSAILSSVRAGGIEKPVHLLEGENTSTVWGQRLPEEMRGPKMVGGGHHRIATELHEHPDERYIPVVHHETFWDARYGAQPRYKVNEHLRSRVTSWRQGNFPYT